MAGGRYRLQVPALALVLLASGIIGMLLGQRVAAPGEDSEIRASLSRFTEVLGLMEQQYANPVNPEEVIYHGAIPGMLRVLDPHSTFFDAQAFARLNEEQRGKYYGIGLQIGLRGNQVVVVAPLAGTPAYRAGIRPGDVIIAVDGNSVGNLNPSQLADRLKGPKNTTVRLTVRREGSLEPLLFVLTREEIPNYSVDVHCWMRPGIGYVHISRFSETTGHELGEALHEFGDLHGFILDLRDNPGGPIAEAVKVAGNFLPKGSVIVSQRGRAIINTVFRAASGNDGRDYPLVLLVNRGTASAAEIVAGALQDHDRGLIVGETTFGKGLVQTVYRLSEKTGMALTTGRYYTPSGRLIQRSYSDISLYDYYFSRSGNKCSDIKRTDSGRPVCSGGGISPDVTIRTPANSPLQNLLMQHYVFFNFAGHYLAHREVKQNFEVDDQVLLAFREYLTNQQLPWSESQLQEHLDWIKANIKSEVFTYKFGRQEGLRVAAESDLQVRKALELLPMARQLLTGATMIAIREQRAPR